MEADEQLPAADAAVASPREKMHAAMEAVRAAERAVEAAQVLCPNRYADSDVTACSMVIWESRNAAPSSRVSILAEPFNMQISCSAHLWVWGICLVTSTS